MSGPRKFWLLMCCAALALGLSVGFGGCSKAEDHWPADKHGLRIMTSIPALYSFASNVAGDDAAVRCLLTTQGPHDYQIVPGDFREVQGANVFFINGLGLDDFAIKIHNNAGNPQRKLVVVGEALPVKQRRETGPIEHEGHTHPGGYDPHIWMGIPEAIVMVQCIRDELKNIDPENAPGYDRRASAYTEKLHKLLVEGRERFAGKRERKLISFHDSLQYFARAFNLEVMDSIEVQPGVEIGGSKLSELIDLAKKHDVRVIAVEPQYPQNTSAHTLMRELREKGVDAEFVEVDPMETVPHPDDLTPDFYERKMRANIDNLAKSLK